MNVAAPVEIHQPETSGYWPTSDQPSSFASLPGPRGFSSPLENLYPDRSQDAEPTFGPPDREPVCYEYLPEDQASGSEADPQEKDRIFSEDQSYRETVRGVRAYMEWSFIPDKEFTAQSRHTTLGPVPGANRLGKYLWPFLQKTGSVEKQKVYE